MRSVEKEGAKQSLKPRAANNTLSQPKILITPPTNSLTKGWNISRFCPLLWHLAQTLV